MSEIEGIGGVVVARRLVGRRGERLQRTSTTEPKIQLELMHGGARRVGHAGDLVVGGVQVIGFECLGDDLLTHVIDVRDTAAV